jgi:hypothetical protein
LLPFEYALPSTDSCPTTNLPANKQKNPNPVTLMHPQTPNLVVVVMLPYSCVARRT